MANYPLFQKALQDSTPFPGTMADTSTPTPMGQMPQMGPETMPPFQAPPETPVATEAPGAPGDRERLAKLDSLIGLVDDRIDYLDKARYVEPNHWKNRFNLVLTGNDMEPAPLMLRRYAEMNDLLKQRAGLTEERRLMTQASPQDETAAKEFADRKRRTEMFQALQDYKQKMGLPPDDPSVGIGFVESGYPLAYGPKVGADKSADTGDALIEMNRAMEAGKEAGVEGVEQLGLTGVNLTAARAAAKQAEAERKAAREPKVAGPESFPVLGMFKDPPSLLSAMERTYDDVIDDPEYTTFVPVTVKNEYGEERESRRAMHTKDQRKAARAEVATRFPGYEKYFPNWVETGEYTPPVSQGEQGDVKVRPSKDAPPKKK